jgi:hypothetical protein
MWMQVSLYGQPNPVLLILCSLPCQTFHELLGWLSKIFRIYSSIRGCYIILSDTCKWSWIISLTMNYAEVLKLGRLLQRVFIFAIVSTASSTNFALCFKWSILCNVLWLSNLSGCVYNVSTALDFHERWICTFNHNFWVLCYYSDSLGMISTCPESL